MPPAARRAAPLAALLLPLMAAPALAQSADTTGMPTCDAFLDAYRRCAASPSVPKEAQSSIRQGIAAMQTGFRDSAASNPATRTALARQCLSLHTELRQRLVDALKCDFPAATQTAEAAPSAAPTPAPAPAPAPVQPPGPPPAQQVATKADAYTEVQNDIVGHHMRRQLADQVTNNERVLKLGTRLGANAWYLFGMDDYDDTIDRLAAAIALPGAIPEIDPAAARLLAALQTLEPIIKSLSRYQTTREFQNDGFRLAREQQPLLVARMNDAIAAATTFGDALFNRRMALDEHRLADMPPGSLARTLLATSLSTRHLVRSYDATNAPADAPAFLTAIADTLAANKDLATTLDTMQPRPNSSCRSYAEAIDILIGRARDYARDIRAKANPDQTSELFVGAYNRSLTDNANCRRNEDRATP